MIQDATNARSADKLGLIERFIVDISRKLLAIAQQFLDGEQVARVVGSQGGKMWLPFTREDIIGEYDFTVEAGSTQPTSEASRRQDAIAMSNVLAPFVEMGVVDPIALVKHLITEGFGVRSFDRFISEDAKQRLEMRKQAEEQQLAAEQQQMMGQPQAQPQAMPQPQAQPQGMPQSPDAQGVFGVGAPQLPPEMLMLLQQEAAAGGGTPGA